MQEDDLAQILEESKTWNEAHGLTGMLLYIEGEFLKYNGGRFIQVLEGDEADVKEIFEKIQTDNRHFNIIKLTEAKMIRRSFEDWSMGFKAMTHTDYKELPGSFELDDSLLEDKKFDNLNVPISFLRSFYCMTMKKA